MNLKLANELSLPLKAAVAQKYAWIGRSSSGKSYCASKVVELLLDAGAQVVIVDPVGIWWGLRLAANGKDPGISIPILGGAHKDIPLEPSSGAKVADFIVETGASMVLDVSEFTGGEQAKFVADFARNLFERKKKNPSPMLLIWEEAQEFVPQNVMRDSARMVGAVERIAKVGRNFGIGTGLISQRPQEVNKKVLNQTEVLFVYQTTGPQERKAIEGWIVEHGIDLSRVVDELPSLPQGTGYIWSPQWLQTFRKFRCHEKRTYDASATPEFKGKGRSQVELAPIDLKKLETAMQETIEKAKADDPKALRGRISELEAEIRRVQAHKPAPEVKEVPVLTEDERLTIEVVQALLNDLKDRHTHFIHIVEECSRRMSPILSRAQQTLSIKHQPVRVYTPVTRPSVAPARPSPEGGTAKLPGGERKILTILAQYPAGRTKVQIAILAGYAVTGGAFNNYLGALRSKGYAENLGEGLAITDAGLDALGAYEPLPTGRALLEYWFGQLGKAERTILQELANEYPHSIAKEDLAARTCYEVKGGGFNNALGKLRTLELINGRHELKAAEELF